MSKKKDESEKPDKPAAASETSTIPPGPALLCETCGPLAEDATELEADGVRRCKKCLARRRANQALRTQEVEREERERKERAEAEREERERQAEEKRLAAERAKREAEAERERTEVREWELRQKGHGKRVRVKSSHPQSPPARGVVVDVGDKGLVISLGGQIVYVPTELVEEDPGE